MRIIDTAQQKIKGLVGHPLYDSVLWFFVILFIVLISFLLGVRYEQARLTNSYPVVIKYNQEALDMWNQYQAIKSEHQNYFASKNGSVVYPLGCDKGNRIKEENKIFFQDIHEAFELGYKEASGC